MTEVQKLEIKKLRLEGIGYKTIGKTLELSENTVKSYCRRNGLGGNLEKSTESEIIPDHCKFCGKEIHQHQKLKRRKFCDETCRTKYWSKNQEKINRKTAITQKYVVCGEYFSDYARNERKYCSRKCYQTARFKGGVSDES